MEPTAALGTSLPLRRVGGLDVVAVDQPRAIAEMVAAVAATAPRIFGFCNAHTVNMARNRADFAAAARQATLFNDGIGLDIAGRLLHGAPFPANLNGTDLTPALLGALPPDTAVFLLGSPPGVAEQAQAALAARFPNLRFVGTRDGFFAADVEAAIAASIRASGAQVVLVGMGHPRQELWAARNLQATGAVLLCIGAFLDFAAGAVPRAPEWARRARMEWAYRLLVEPRRMARRYLIGNVAFLWHVARQRMAGPRG